MREGNDMDVKKIVITQVGVGRKQRKKDQGHAYESDTSDMHHDYEYVIDFDKKNTKIKRFSLD